MDLCDFSATALVDLIARREVSAREVMIAFLERVDRLNPTYNAIVSRRDADVLVAEAEAAAPGRLHGLPMAIKDTADTAGIRTTRGSPLLAEFVPPTDGIAVGRVRAAGAIVIGKTNVPEFALGSHTYNPVFGATGNAWDPTLSAGGSSGGAAVAVAHRMVPFADGSDLGGSIRNPPAWNNVFGLRPSQGLVPSRSTVDSFWSQLATEGPIARNAEDLALLLAVQAGYDIADPLSLNVDGVGDGLDTALDVDLAGSRVGWLADLGGHLATESGVLDVAEQALTALAGSGLHIEPVTRTFDWERLWRAFVVLRQFGLDASLGPLFRDPATLESTKPELQWELSNAASLTAGDLRDAIATRTSWYHTIVDWFDDYDYLALPSAQVAPFPIDTTWPRHIAGVEMDSYHRWMEVSVPGTMSGCPILAAPAGFDARGVPNGIQLIGRPRADLSLLQLARHFEQVAPWLDRQPG